LNRAEFFASSSQPIATFDSPDLDKWVYRHISMSNDRIIDGQPAIAYLVWLACVVCQ